MDCTITEVFIKEKSRMCRSVNCMNCAFSNLHNGTGDSCAEYFLRNPSIAIKVVQQWSDEHPPESILQHFLKEFPNALIDENGIPKTICPRDLGYPVDETVGCDNKDDCKDCWNKEYTIIKEKL